jgi:Calcineurin-like phosphoesterase
MHSQQKVRDNLDLDYIIAALLRDDRREDIADRETTRLGVKVTKNVIIGVARDLKSGSLKATQKQAVNNGWISTYIFGVEPDNGGIPMFTGHLTLDEERVVIISDLHLPYMDYNFAANVAPVIKYTGAKTVICGGDTFHGEQKSGWRKSKGGLVRTTSLSSDMALATKYFEGLVDAGAEQIFVAAGNHDNWLVADWNGDLQFNEVLAPMISDKLRGRLIITPYDRLSTHSGGELWTVFHQVDYSVNNLSVGDKLAQKFHTNAFVTHQHETALGFDRFGRYVVCDLGGLHDPLLTAYLGLKTSTRPNPDRGFASLVDGHVELWTPDKRITNWSDVYNGLTGQRPD